MTPIFLLEAIKKICEEETGDMVLQVKNDDPLKKAKEGKLSYFLGKTPKKNSSTKYVPFIIIRFLSGKDNQDEGENTESTCTVRIITCIYNEDEEKGYIDALNVITAIRTRLLQDRLIDRRFQVRMPLEYIIYEDDTENYTIGEMVVTCDMPSIEKHWNHGKELDKWTAQ